MWYDVPILYIKDGLLLTKKRIDWVDYAKGMTIILVVFTHSMTDDFSNIIIKEVNFNLASLRLPFFFFIAGLFIKKSLFSDFKHFFKSKIALFFYIFVLWSLIRYLTDTIPRYFLLNDSEVDLGSILTIFIDPPATLWFIYALLIFFILARITRLFPKTALTISLLLFVASTLNGQYEFVDKLARFFPLFLLGYLSSRRTLSIAEKIKPYHLAIPIMFFFVASQFRELGWENIAAPSFALSILGIASGIVLAKILSGFSSLSFIKYIGEKSLVVYVLHYLPLNVSKVIFPILIPNSPTLSYFITVVLGVTIPLIIESIVRKLKMDWLFRLPNFLINRHRDSTKRVA